MPGELIKNAHLVVHNTQSKQSSETDPIVHGHMNRFFRNKRKMPASSQIRKATSPREMPPDLQSKYARANTNLRPESVDIQ